MAQAASSPDAPIVFVEKLRGAMRIAALSPAAHALGIARGMALADVRAQSPEIDAIVHDPAADMRLLERMADVCDRYTPSVAIDPPDALVLDITGCTHHFGNEALLAADMRRRFSEIHIRVACTSTPEAAAACARYASTEIPDEAEAVRRLPVAALGVEDSIGFALCRAGLTTIGAVAARPTAPIAARFGAETVTALDRLLGRVDSRIVPRRVPPALIVERRFAEPIAIVDVALAVLQELIGEAASEMEQRGRGGRRFAARFYRSDGAVADLVAETSRPVRDAAVVMRLFHERIAALADPVDPGFGFDMIRLAVPVLEPLSPAQIILEGDASVDDGVAAMVDRLGARLGQWRVRRFVPVDSHIPECASNTVPAANVLQPASWPVCDPEEPPFRPLHLFDPPQCIEVIAEVPDGPPRRFTWRRAAHDVMLHEGPERIASEWWCTSGSSLTRDYYRVEDVDGRRFWIFRHGLFGTEKAHPEWYLHGLFA